MSLADELLNDLDGLSDDGGPSETEEPIAGPSSLPSNSNTNGNGKRRRDPNDNGDGDDDEDEEMKAQDEAPMLESGESAVGFVPVGGVKPAEEVDRDEVAMMNLESVEDVESVAKLHKSRKLQDALSVSAVSSLGSENHDSRG